MASLIKFAQTEVTHEIGIVFYNTPQPNEEPDFIHPDATKAFEDLTSGQYFIEFIQGNLSASNKEQHSSSDFEDAGGYSAFKEEEEKPSSGLLSDEKVGIPRLIEALQCSMWSNMEKISTPSESFNFKEETVKKKE